MRRSSKRGHDVEVIGDRWGVTADEVHRTYPCDAFVASPVLQLWRGVDIAAPVTAVWPWVTQIRLAPYSYDWLDNRFRRSPRELRGLADPRPGEPFITAATGELGEVLSVAPREQLTGQLLGVVMSYVLDARHDGTRLVLKLTSDRFARTAPVLAIGDLIMARRQLLNWKRLAESHRHGPRSG